MKPSELAEGVTYEDCEGNHRKINKLESSVVRYTITACPTFPSHVGKDYTASPKWFANEVFGVVPDEETV